MSFIENKIPLDEIIIWDKRQYHEDAEVGDAHKTAQRLIKEYNLKTKLNAFELPWNYHLNIYKTFGKDWIFLPGCQLSFNQTNRIVKTTILDGFAEIKKKNNKIKVGYVEAHDKPRVNLYQGKWYQFYIDIAMITYIGKGGCEMFYFSPEVPELHVKQTHMSIKYFENLLKTYPGANENLVHQVQSFNELSLYAEWNRHIGRICNQNFSAQHGFMKKNDILKNPRISTLLKLLNYTEKWQKDVYDTYAGGLDRIREMSHGKIDVFSGDMPGIMSKQYFVKDFH